MMPRRRFLPAAVLAAVLIGAALILGAAGEAPVLVRMQTIALVPAHPALVVSGTVQARVQADLGFRVAGKVIGRPVEIGDRVRRGQVLAELDPADLRNSLAVAEAALQSAEADAANAQADLRRYDGLGRGSPAYLPSEYDRRLAASRTAAARVVQAQRQRELARDQLGYTTLSADADGVITALPVQIGQVVAAGQTVATLAHGETIEVVADVPENRLSEMRGAGEVSVGLWALPELRLRGRVREIGALADPASRTFAVRVTLLDPPPDVVALGMTATVSFGDTQARAAIIPAAALADLRGQPAVWVVDPTTQTAKLRAVAVAGYDGAGRAVIADGLRAGETIVTAGVGQIRPEMRLAAWGGAAR